MYSALVLDAPVLKLGAKLGPTFLFLIVNRGPGIRSVFFVV